FDRADDVAERDIVGDESVWIEIDLVLLYEATDRRDFRDAFHRGQRVAQIPILNRAQLCEIVFAGVVNERVLVNPPHTGCVRPDYRLNTLAQRAAHRTQLFNNARS